jgi:hypothetical protein
MKLDSLSARRGLSRRDFLQLSAGSLGALSASSGVNGQPGGRKTVSLVVDPADPVASSTPVALAVRELGDALAQQGLLLQQFPSVPESPANQVCIAVASPGAPLASTTLQRGAVQEPSFPGSFAIAPSEFDHRPGVLLCGSDPRGTMYAVRELADRVRYATDPARALRPEKPSFETPFTEVRSVGRLFVSDVEDRPWFEDREFWPPYLSMLASQRFNRLHLALGIGYDSLQGVTDSYLLFAYPFLQSTPGYNVRAVNLPDEVRERNLELLQFIGSQAVAHGLDFQLGLWTHGYRWADSPRANYTIDGLTADNHAAYCRDSLATLLRSCPAVSGVTLRTHAESGVREGSYEFWRTVFAGAAQCGRKVEIDLHTKGLDRKMIDGALATGLPVKLSPKYWAEHVGMPYHQTAIRELEMPREHVKPDETFSALSTGSRSFTRYGYADFLREDRPYSVMYRVWPGTHRVLLTGDPQTTAAHARTFRFCGANGAELFEPLSFKGRRGSGIAGGRCAYADSSLRPSRDWEKYLYTYRLWGRLLYNPDADPQQWRRYLSKEFRASAPAVEGALANASRILPLVTTAHMPSAANDTYVPELYTNQPIADATLRHPFGDTPSPKVCGNVSPLDPQLFSSCAGFVEEHVTGKRTGRYSPIEVAAWLDELAATATHQLAEADKHSGADRAAAFHRVAIDVQVHTALGRFFAAKLRSATLYTLHGRTGNRAALEKALQEYQRARATWSQLAQGPGKAYVSDITIGPLPHQRGHWADRLPAMDRDIEAMERQLAAAPAAAAAEQVPQVPLTEAARFRVSCNHQPPASYVAGESLAVALVAPKPVATVRMYYRHVDQGEDYQVTPMDLHDGQFRASIPARYTASSYPLQYFFELQSEAHGTTLYPGFETDRLNRPYFVVRPAPARAI